VADEHPDLWRRTLRSRLLYVAVAFGVWTTAIEARLLYLQVYKSTELQARAERQQLRTVKVPAKRGDIVDRQGRLLAYSADADSVYAVPSAIEDPGATIAALCRILGSEECNPDFRATLARRLQKKNAFAWVKRQVSPSTARAIQALELEGVGLTKESRRFYPNKNLLANVLGYVGLDNEGLEGIEAALDRRIRGTDGVTFVHADARRHAFNRVERPPTAGASIELTIDEMLQHIAERELRAGVEEHRAVGGSVIIMDPWTGEILAMANAPSFNPNAYSKWLPDHRRNRAVTDIYEPGSTFKIVTASAAIEERVLGPEAWIDCSPGHINIGSRRVYDVHTYGVLSFTDVIVKSSNVGAIKVGFRLGPERIGRYVRRFGFGTRLSPDLPGEVPGIVWNQLSDDALASVSIGYQVGVTPLQMASAVSSIANGGQLLEPHIVRAIQRGDEREVVKPRVLRRTVAPETAATLTTIMEDVVVRGTARAAQVNGYTIAGKTGTAAKIVKGAYSKSEYMSSFAGFAPSRKPAVTILVVIDSPRRGSTYGGAVAAPIFKRIAEATLRQLGIAPTINPATPILVARPHLPQVNATVQLPAAMLPAREPMRPGVMPDVVGLSARDALRALARAGVAPRMRGTGFVLSQEPAAGTSLDSGGVCSIELDRVPIRTAAEDQ
jgi:cell division protein FtsI (penicillin-binding protein 3)